MCKKKVGRVKFYLRCVDIPSMKKLALIMMISTIGVVSSAEEYTIQTISAQKESSITPAFEKKVQKSALHSEKKKEGSCNIVTVGKYPTTKAAHHDLAKAKVISKDAFVRPLVRTTPKACEVHSAAAEVKVHTDEVKTSRNVQNEKLAEINAQSLSVKKEESVAMTHESTVSPAADRVVSTQAVVVPVVQEEKREACKVQPCENVTYVYDRNLVHKSDLQEAIEYYKRSPYYTFRPVALQR